MEFRCRLGTAAGQAIKGMYVAPSEAHLRRELEDKGLHVLTLTPRGGVQGFSIGRRRIRRDEFLIFNQELATLLKAGMPLVQSLTSCELDALKRRIEQLQHGRGATVLLTGEAGIGKSRLLRQFKQDVGGVPNTWIEGESSPYEQDTPFAPTIDLIENAFEWTADATAEKKIADLENSFSLVGMDTTNPFRWSRPCLASRFHRENIRRSCFLQNNNA